MLAALQWIGEELIYPVVAWLIDSVVKLVLFVVISPITAIVIGFGFTLLGAFAKTLPWAGYEDTLAALFTAVGRGLLFAGIGAYLFGGVAEEVGEGILISSTFAAMGATLGLAYAALAEPETSLFGLGAFV